jgi:maltose-binding protein MalE
MYDFELRLKTGNEDKHNNLQYYLQLIKEDNFQINENYLMIKEEGINYSKIKKLTDDFYEYELEVFSDLVERFNKKYEGQIKVKLVQKPSDGYETAVQQSLSGEKLDVFYVGDAGYKAYAEQGLLFDITDLVANSPIYDLSTMWSNI